MRTELRAIQQRVGITFIYITHDQGEALTMSDRVGVIDGQLEQVGRVMKYIKLRVLRLLQLLLEKTMPFQER